MNKKLPFFCGVLIVALFFNVSVKAECRPWSEIEKLWNESVIIDGTLLTYYRDIGWPIDFSKVHTDSGVNVYAGKLSSDLNTHISNLKSRNENPTINIVLTAADLRGDQINDSYPEQLVYIQKPWKIDFTGNDSVDYNLAKATGDKWANEYSLRIVQLEYGATSNCDLYDPGEHFAGVQSSSCRTSSSTSKGLTKYGDWLANLLLKNGVILDVSHARDETVQDTIALSRQYSARRGRSVPVLANHANLNEPGYRQHQRNKTLAQACDIASTGGVIGIMPVATFLPSGASFFDLIDQITTLKNHNCGQLSWDGRQIDMINHISVATDSNTNYWETGSPFYVDKYAAKLDRWKILASRMREDRNNDGLPDFSLDEIKKIFGENTLRAYRAGLYGQLPFEPEYTGSAATSEIFVGDFNGDGRDDLLSQNNQGVTWIDYAHMGGEFSGTDWNRQKAASGTKPDWCRISSNRKLYIGDFNGDGHDDMLCHQYDGKTWINYANSKGEFKSAYWTRHTEKTPGADLSWCSINSNRKLYVGDFNGDGRDDLMCHQSDGKTWVDLASSNGRFYGTNWSRTGDSNSSTDRDWCRVTSGLFELHIGDFNGDGRDDMLCQKNSGKTWIDYADSNGYFQGTNWSRPSSSLWCGTGQVSTGDFNADGRDDLLCTVASQGIVSVDYADNLGRFSLSDWSTNSSFCRLENESTLIGDVNGNGQSDVLCFASDTGHLTMLLSAASKVGLVGELLQ